MLAGRGDKNNWTNVQLCSSQVDKGKSDIKEKKKKKREGKYLKKGNHIFLQGRTKTE